MPRNENQVCENCAFWQKPVGNQDDVERGKCRKNAPIIPPTNMLHYRLLKASKEDPVEECLNQGHWPFTWPDDWCGEFQAATANGVGS